MKVQLLLKINTFTDMYQKIYICNWHSSDATAMIKIYILVHVHVYESI